MVTPSMAVSSSRAAGLAPVLAPAARPAATKRAHIGRLSPIESALLCAYPCRMTMKRAFLLVMDSVGIGGAEDADAFGDAGADTLGHIADACAGGTRRPRRPALGPLKLPNLTRLGLGAAAKASTGTPAAGARGGRPTPEAIHGYGVESSTGKDTPSGHWEIAGVPVVLRLDLFSRNGPGLPAGADRRADRRGRSSPASSATSTPRACRSSRRSARSTSAPASRSATPRPTRSSRSPRTRAISASTGSTRPARSRGGCATRSMSAG